MTVTADSVGGRPVSELGTSAADTGAFFHSDSGGCSEQGEELSGGGEHLQFGSTAMKLAMLWLVLVGMSVVPAEAKLRSSFKPKWRPELAFSVETAGAGAASLYIAGPGELLRRKVQLGENGFLRRHGSGSCRSYVAFLVESSKTEGTNSDGATSQSVEFDVGSRPTRCRSQLSG